jgi:hypothetical protein
MLSMIACNVGGMMVKVEDHKKDILKCSSAVLKADPSDMDMQITELASASIVDIESMKKLVDLLCSPAVDASQASLAHSCFLRQWNVSLTASHQDCIRKSGLLDDIRYYKVAGLITSVTAFWCKYNSGFYGPYQLSCDVRDDIEDMC